MPTTPDVCLHIHAATSRETLTVHYQLVNTLCEDLFVYNRFSSPSVMEGTRLPSFAGFSSSLAYTFPHGTDVVLLLQGRVVKPSEPTPRCNLSPTEPYCSKIAPGATAAGTLTLPLPIFAWDPYHEPLPGDALRRHSIWQVTLRLEGAFASDLERSYQIPKHDNVWTMTSRRTHHIEATVRLPEPITLEYGSEAATPRSAEQPS